MGSNEASHPASHYEPPALTEYGTIEEWTLGRSAPIIQISIII